MGDEFVCVAIKPVAPVLEVDWLTGEVRTEPRHLVRTPADDAACAVGHALALALRCELRVVAVAGPSAEEVLRTSLAEGAHRAVRVVVGDDDADTSMPSNQWSSDIVAASLAVVTDGAQVVVCGDASGDRASGTVPARLASLRQVPQALSLRDVDVENRRILATRRLDGGRRERLAIEAPCVLSVEAGAAVHERATLREVLASRGVDAPYEERRVPAPPRAHRGDPAGSSVGPFRPRASSIAAPSASDPALRAIELAGTLVTHDPPELLVCDPDEAAAAILERLDRWDLR